jgi:hypothetical protein
MSRATQNLSALFSFPKNLFWARENDEAYEFGFLYGQDVATLVSRLTEETRMRRQVEDQLTELQATRQRETVHISPESAVKQIPPTPIKPEEFTPENYIWAKEQWDRVVEDNSKLDNSLHILGIDKRQLEIENGILSKELENSRKQSMSQRRPSNDAAQQTEDEPSQMASVAVKADLMDLVTETPGDQIFQDLTESESTELQQAAVSPQQETDGLSNAEVQVEGLVEDHPEPEANMVAEVRTDIEAIEDQILLADSTMNGTPMIEPVWQPDGLLQQHVPLEFNNTQPNAPGQISPEQSLINSMIMLFETAVVRDQPRRPRHWHRDEISVQGERISHTRSRRQCRRERRHRRASREEPISNESRQNNRSHRQHHRRSERENPHRSLHAWIKLQHQRDQQHQLSLMGLLFPFTMYMKRRDIRTLSLIIRIFFSLLVFLWYSPLLLCLVVFSLSALFCPSL